MRTIETLGQRLQLDPVLIETFLLHEKIVVPGNSALSREIQQLTHDAAVLLSDGCHRSIIELLKLEEFVPDVRWIARVINVSVDEVNVALTRLLRLGLLEMSDAEGWVDKSGEANGVDQNQFGGIVIQRLFTRVRDLQSAENRPRHESLPNLPAFKLAINSIHLPIVIEMIRRLEGELGKRSADYDEQDLQLEIGIFPNNSATNSTTKEKNNKWDNR
jgi:hypothetical protein